MAGGINIQQKLHSKITKVIDAKSSDYNTLASLTEVKCQGYTKLMVWYQVTTGWDRAGTIYVYGSLWSDDANDNSSYVRLDDTIENENFAVAATDDTGYTGKGQIYVIENIPPYIKIGWDNTTAGTTGTITVYAMPFNE